MYFEQEQLAYDEIEINILLFLKKCVQNVKWIIICAVVSAVAISSLMYLKNMKEYEKKNSEFIVKELTEEELEAVDRYYLLNAKVEQLQTYKANSPIMQMDCNDVYQYTINYYISGNIREDVAVAIENYISGMLFATEFSNNIDNLAAEYVKDVVTCLTAEIDSGVISIKILAANEKDIQDYIDVFKSIIMLYSDKLQEDIGSHKLEILYEEITHGYLEEVYSMQDENYESISSLETALSNYFGILSIREKNYINQSLVKPVEGVMTKPTFQINYMFIGMGIGAIACVLAIVILSLLDGKLHSEKETSKRLQIIYYGLIGREIDIEQLEIVISYIVKSCETAKKQNVAIISTLNSLLREDMQFLIDTLKNNNIQCNVLGNVLKNSDAIEKLSTDIPVILIEEVGKSKIKDIYEEAAICKDLGIQVLGYSCIIKK